MQCPIDKTDLVVSDRQGIEIDYCPKCRGVWLDREELDKIIERSGNDVSGQNRDDRNDNDEGGFLDNIFGGFGRDND